MTDPKPNIEWEEYGYRVERYIGGVPGAEWLDCGGGDETHGGAREWAKACANRYRCRVRIVRFLTKCFLVENVEPDND